MTENAINTLAVLLIAGVLMAGTACAGQSLDAGQTVSGAAATLAVLPFSNYTGDASAETIGDSLIAARLLENGWNVIPRERLREVLRKYRIRSKNGVGADQVSRVAGELAIDFFLIGSYDIYIDEDIPEASLSIRMIDPRSGRLVMARSEAASGEDFAGLFGLGRIVSIDTLYSRIIARLFSDIDPVSIGKSRDDKSARPAPRAAIVPFDDLSNRRFAGQIVSSILLSELTAAGWDVALPGDVFHLFRINNRIPRGEIDLDLAGQIADKLNCDYIITGSVLSLSPGRAGTDGSTSRIELIGRLIDARKGVILSTASVGLKGSDSETIFRSGTCYSLGKLARRCMMKMRKKLIETEKIEFADDN